MSERERKREMRRVADAHSIHKHCTAHTTVRLLVFSPASLSVCVYLNM